MCVFGEGGAGEMGKKEEESVVFQTALITL